MKQAKERNLEKKRDVSPGFAGAGDTKQEREKKNYGINRKNINPAFMKQEQQELASGEIEIFVNENQRVIEVPSPTKLNKDVVE